MTVKHSRSVAHESTLSATSNQFRRETDRKAPDMTRADAYTEIWDDLDFEPVTVSPEANAALVARIRSNDTLSREDVMTTQEQTTEQIAAQYDTLRAFMPGEFEQEEFADLAYGIDGGFAHFTYTVDLRAIYDAYESEIWAMARDMADDFGQEVMEFVASLGGGGRIDDDDSLKTWLVWFAAEQYAREFSES
jgi:hypothetical protein